MADISEPITEKKEKKIRKKKTEDDAAAAAGEEEVTKPRKSKRTVSIDHLAAAAEKDLAEKKQQQRSLEAAAYASMPQPAEPDAEMEAASLDTQFKPASPTDQYYFGFERFASDVCGSFNTLSKMARDLNISLATPEIVFVGPRGHGKSYVLETLLGQPLMTGSASTKRPVVYNVLNATADKMKCTVKRDAVLHEHDHDVEVAPELLGAEIDKRCAAAATSTEPIIVQVESNRLLTMTVIDTPGLIVDPNDTHSSVVEQVVLKMISPANRLIVSVRNSVDATLPPTSSDYVMDIIKQVDPEFTRTTILYTRLNPQLQQFQNAKAVNKFLSGSAAPDVKTFFATLPAPGLREKLATDPAGFMLKIVQCEKRDLAVLEQLQYDKRYQQVVGIPAVLKHICSGFVWRAYQEAAPRLIKVLRQRKTEAAALLAEQTKQLEQLSPAFFRVVASDYSMEFLRTLEKLIRGTSEGNPAVNGQTLEQELMQCGVDAQWVDGRGLPIAVDPAEWDVPHWQNKLYGGQQFERLLAEFHAVSDHIDIPELSRDEVATAAGIPKLHNVPNFAWAASDLARQKSQETFEPLVNQLTERAVYVMKRLTEIAESILSDKRHLSHQRQLFGTTSNSSSNKIDAANVQLYPYFLHFVKDQYFKFVDETAQRCKETCMDEFYSTRTVHWDLTENEHFSALERNEQVPDLAKTLFKKIKARITRNVLLKFYNFFLVPLETSLWTEMQRRIGELTDKSLEDLFETNSIKDAFANTEIRHQTNLKDYEAKEKTLLEAATLFSHPNHSAPAN